MSQFPFHTSQFPGEELLQASKWLAFRLLVDEHEMAALIQTCESLFICNVSECVEKEGALLSHGRFLSCYRDYITRLRQGESPSRRLLRPFFSTAWTASAEALLAFPTPHQQWIIKPVLPIIQLSAHFFTFSAADRRFRSMVHGREAIPWGLQFSYPQLYARSKQGDVCSSLKDPHLPNYRLFNLLKDWVKNQTRPARFYFRGKRMTATFRVTRAAANWMASYPSLKQAGLDLQI